MHLGPDTGPLCATPDVKTPRTEPVGSTPALSEPDGCGSIVVLFSPRQPGRHRTDMNDPCHLDLIRTPRVTAHASWVWSRQNTPTSSDENRSG